MGKLKNEFITLEDEIYAMLGFFSTTIIINNNKYDCIDQLECKLTEDMNINGVLRIKFGYEMAMSIVTVQPLNNVVGRIFTVSA